MFQLRKYHGDRVQSLTYEDDHEAFSVGIITPGEYEFGAIKKEITTVTSGRMKVWIEGKDEWFAFHKDETFIVPEHKNFKFKVDEICSYICFYE